jgi:hypothetical protein
MGIRLTPLSMSIVVFALTLGLLMRDQLAELAGHRPHARPAAAVMPSGASPSSKPVAPETSPASAPAPSRDHNTPGKSFVQAAAAAAQTGIQTDTQSSEPDAAAQERPPQRVPVTLEFHPGEGPDPEVARLQNLTNIPLSVSITAIDSATRSQANAQVTILPHRRADLLAAGLSIHPGDEVRIQSPQYSEMTFTVQ